jgi:hypothetical protein
LEADLSTSAPKPKAKSPYLSFTKAFESKKAASDAAALDEPFFAGFDSFMTTLSKGVDDLLLGGQPKPAPIATPVPSSRAPEPDPHYTEARSQVPFQGALYSGSPAWVTSASRRFTPQSHRGSGSMPPATLRPKMDRFTAVAPPRYEGYRSMLHPSLEHGGDNPTEVAMDEARDPSNEYYRRRVSNNDGGSSNGSGGRNQRSVELLPGLEADDILPGITETNVWKNVLEHLLVSKTGDEKELEEVSVALQRTAVSLKQNQDQTYHRRLSSHDRENATVPTVELEPKISPLTFSGFQQSHSPVPESRTGDPARGDFRSDSDEIIAEDPPQPHRVVESDDTLWGFLTCRATDAI